MTSHTLEDWLRGRTPSVPVDFLPHLIPPSGGLPPTTAGLTDSGCDALASALSRPGRDRDGAYSLLAGDAFLTYACEAIAGGEADPAVALESLTRSLGTRFS